MTNLPWMQIYIGDELAETAHLSAEEYGAHMRLRLHQWKHGELPSDEDRLMRISHIERDRWPAVRDVLAPLYDWVWHHKRTAEVRRQSEEKHANLSANGKRGGRPRKADGKPMESQAFDRHKADYKADGKQSPSPSPSPLHSKSPAPTPAAAPPPGRALDEREDEDTGSMFTTFPVPPSAAEARKILTAKGVPASKLDECVRMMMGGNLGPYELEGYLEEARSVA